MLWNETKSNSTDIIIHFIALHDWTLHLFPILGTEERTRDFVAIFPGE